MKPTEIFTNEPFDEYRANDAHCMSSHRLDEFRRCPRTFWLKETGQLPRPDSEAFAFGRAVHVRITEGKEAFNEQFAIGGPINPRTGSFYGRETKAFQEWALDIGKPILTPSEYEKLEAMAFSVESNPLTRIATCAPIVEGVARATVCGVPCQIRVDVAFDNEVLDLKTCRSLDTFEQDAETFGYHRQMAFYRLVMERLGCKPFPNFYLIAVEKEPPYRAAAWYYTAETWARCIPQVVQSLRDYRRTLDEYTRTQDESVWRQAFSGLNPFH